MFAINSSSYIASSLGSVAPDVCEQHCHAGIVQFFRHDYST